MFYSLKFTHFAQQADVLHIESSHLATRNADKTHSTGFNQKYFVATVGNRRYTLNTLAAFGPGNLDIGSDHPVVKITDRSIKIRVTDKKGRESTESPTIVDVSEMKCSGDPKRGCRDLAPRY